MTKKTKVLCVGCHEDFYNHNRPEGCWRFAKAKLVQRTKVGAWQNPPYIWKPQTTLACHSPNESCWIKDDDCRIEN